MRLTKHHGLGNDFLIALLDAVPFGAPQLARRVCDRRTGVGADGLIIGVVASSVEFRLFNSDGSSAEVSGNGLRCFAQALARDRGLDHLDITVATLAGPRRIQLHDGGLGADGFASVEMGVVAAGPQIPEDIGLIPGMPVVRHAATGDIGNPHLVVHVDDPGSIDLAVVGPAVEAHLGPINVEFVRKSGPSTIDLVVWERGAGITQACGSGACVAAQRSHDWGLVGDTVEVRMPGGTATVGLGDHVVLTGPTTYIATIEVPA